MKKKYIVFIIALMSITLVSLYVFNEYKTKNFVQNLFKTDSLAEETHDITIINHDPSIIHHDLNDLYRITTAIRKDSTLFPTFINSLEKINVKRTSEKYKYGEGYSFVIYHNNALHNIRLNKNGLLTFNGENYKIQNQQAFEELLEIVKKAPNK